MTTDRDAGRRPRFRKTGAALVIAAGAILTALSIAALLYQAFGDPEYETYDWPVYAVLTIASLALMWKGIRDWQEL